jgi:hypothetical protein
MCGSSPTNAPDARHPAPPSPTNIRLMIRVPVRTVPGLCMRICVGGWKYLLRPVLSSFRAGETEPGIHAVTVQGIDSAPIFVLICSGMDYGSSLRSSGMTKFVDGRCQRLLMAALSKTICPFAPTLYFFDARLVPPGNLHPVGDVRQDGEWCSGAGWTCIDWACR